MGITVKSCIPFGSHQSVWELNKTGYSSQISGERSLSEEKGAFLTRKMAFFGGKTVFSREIAIFSKKRSLSNSQKGVYEKKEVFLVHESYSRLEKTFSK